MKLRFLCAGAIAGGALLSGCTSVDPIGTPEYQEFSTLDVQYGNPGPTPDPCDDVLPQIDGVAQDQEWSSALPLILRMTGSNGTGGAAFNLELRAIWTDEARVGGANRIYLLARYADDDLNDQADRLAYVVRRPPGEFCVEVEDARGFCASPPPLYSGACDPALIDPEADRWERLNADGREDQVLLLLREVPDPAVASDLVDLNVRVLGVVGKELVPGASLGAPGSPTDLWIWRATRTNLHPVPQFPNWSVLDPETGVPDLIFSRFPATCGFGEDGWIDNSGVLRADGGASDAAPFVKNFVRRDPVPDRLTECPSSDRPAEGEEVETRNGGLPVDLAMWWTDATTFQVCDTSACTRVGQVRTWSTRLQSGEYDFVPGWGLQVPGGSRRDVRARGTYGLTQEKGFAVRSVEFMRDLNTTQADDIVIQALDGSGVPTPTGRYRLTVGVFDNSGRIASGSSEVYLRFAPPAARVGVVDRCR